MTNIHPIMAVLAVLVFGSACSTMPSLSLSNDEPRTLTKRFYDGAIQYTVDVEAQQQISKLVSLQASTDSLGAIDETMANSDRMTLPLYRDADIDRDHHISAEEAALFYGDYVRRFEDGVGKVVYR